MGDVFGGFLRREREFHVDLGMAVGARCVEARLPFACVREYRRHRVPAVVVLAVPRDQLFELQLVVVAYPLAKLLDRFLPDAGWNAGNLGGCISLEPSGA